MHRSRLLLKHFRNAISFLTAVTSSFLGGKLRKLLASVYTVAKNAIGGGEIITTGRR